jgi:hypothetical protein
MTDQPGNTPADNQPRPGDTPPADAHGADRQREPAAGDQPEPAAGQRREPERPGPYQGVFGSPGQPGPTGPGTSGAPGATPQPADRPSPYPGSFGQPNAPTQPSEPTNQPSAPFGTFTPGPGSFGPPPNQPGTGYGPPGTPYPQQPSPYAYQPITPAPPKQVTIAAAISFGIGGLSVLLGLFSLTSAGEQISEILTGSPDSQGVVVVAILISSVAYILPAIFVRKRRPWARTMLIVVAAIGIAGGLMALPGSILGLAIHATLLILLLQQPTKLWFTHR